MKRWLIVILIFLFSACSSAAEPPPALEDIGESNRDPTPTAVPQPTLIHYGKAPELTNQVWLNTDQPLRLADLRGKVVLLDMWTFG